MFPFSVFLLTTLDAESRLETCSATLALTAACLEVATVFDWTAPLKPLRTLELSPHTLVASERLSWFVPFECPCAKNTISLKNTFFLKLEIRFTTERGLWGLLLLLNHLRRVAGWIGGQEVTFGAFPGECLHFEQTRFARFWFLFAIWRFSRQ